MRPADKYEALPEAERFVGAGRFGWVKKVKRVSDGKIIACKSVRYQDSETSKTTAARECAILKQLKHPNIIEQIEVEWRPHKAKIYMEYCEGGSLQDLIDRHKLQETYITELDVWRILNQLASALVFCHLGLRIDRKGQISNQQHSILDWKPILHRDIKPANVFLRNRSNLALDAVKLGDFGLGYILQNNAAPETYAGTPQYMAPEVSQFSVRAIHWTEHCDIFSLGCTVYALCALKPPFDYHMEANSNTYSPLPKKYSTELGECIDSYLSFYAETRPSAIRLFQQSQHHLDALQRRQSQIPLPTKIVEGEQGEPSRPSIRAGVAPLVTEKLRHQNDHDDIASPSGIRHVLLTSLDNSDSESSTSLSTQDQASAHKACVRRALAERVIPISANTTALSTSEIVDDDGFPSPSISEVIDDNGFPNPSTSEIVDDDGFPSPSISEVIDDDGFPSLSRLRYILLTSLDNLDSESSTSLSTQDQASAHEACVRRALAERVTPAIENTTALSISEVATSTYGNVSREFKTHFGWVRNIVFSPDWKQIASGSGSGAIRLWDLATGAVCGTLRGHSAWARAIAFSLDGKQIISGSDDKTVKLWDLTTGAAYDIGGHSGSVWAIAFSRDGKQVASGSENKMIQLWDLTTSTTYDIGGHSDSVCAIAFSPDGKQIASGSKDRTVRLWDLATRVVRSIEVHSGCVWAVAFSPDGKQIASGSEDRTVRLWDSATGAPCGTLEGHSGSVRAVTFSPDGKQIASGCDRTVRLWYSLPTASCDIFVCYTQVANVAFSPDGRLIASGSGHGVINLFPPRPPLSSVTSELHT